MRTSAYFLRAALIGLVRGRVMSALTVGITAAALGILGGFLLLERNLRALAADWDRVQIHAFLTDEAADRRHGEVEELVAAARALPSVAQVRLVSREEALSDFRRRLPDLAGAADSLQSNPFPASLEITTRGGRSPGGSGADDLLDLLGASPLVESIQDTREEAHRLSTALGLITSGGLLVGSVLAAASVFIIFSVIRLTVHARRDEIAVLRLVGATGGFIRGPYLVEGVLQGLLGAAGALAMLWAGQAALADYAGRSGNALAGLLSARFLPPTPALLLAAGGAVIGLAGSALSLRRPLAD